ncbi:Bgt-60024 [Blumeria graminis f. sp. tritici]|uniref:Bgt-60024 n=1 Tax=Blumeria graminis f. sp. tritici TaxID=62690 RepID=A0A9X9PRI3_BLUGR|nr:Bgt-60024 [Blumeria graminis f. sp. tritici]
MVSSFLDDSSCYSKGIISSSFSKVQYQSYSHGDFSSPFLGDSSIFYVAFAPARSPVVVRQYLPVLATGNIGFVAVTQVYLRGTILNTCQWYPLRTSSSHCRACRAEIE